MLMSIRHGNGHGHGHRQRHGREHEDGPDTKIKIIESVIHQKVKIRPPLLK
jgi:hypothetical protein